MELHPLIPISNRNEKPRDTSAKVGLFSLAKFEVVGTTCEQQAIWLVVDLPLWKIWKSVGILIPIIYGKKTVPNHQPDLIDVLRMFYNIHQHLQPLNL